MEKRIMKYKVGDKVRVRENLSTWEEYDNGCCFNSSMTVFLGKTVTICLVREDINRYKIEEDGMKWNWADSMFEPLESENPADETNDSEEWFLCRDDINKLNDAVKDVVHADAEGTAESADCLLELKFKEAVRKITPDDLKMILLKKIEDSVKNMSDDVIQDILAEALG